MASAPVNSPLCSAPSSLERQYSHSSPIGVPGFVRVYLQTGHVGVRVDGSTCADLGKALEAKLRPLTVLRIEAVAVLRLYGGGVERRLLSGGLQPAALASGAPSCAPRFGGRAAYPPSSLRRPRCLPSPAYSCNASPLSRRRAANQRGSRLAHGAAPA